MSKTKAILITFFLGGFGVHRFMAKKTGTGILWLLTGGCFGIGWLVDLIQVCCGTFKDAYGNVWGNGVVPQQAPYTQQVPYTQAANTSAFCTKCGASIDSTAQFCTHCGAPRAASSGVAYSSSAAKNTGNQNTGMIIGICCVIGAVLVAVVGYSLMGMNYETASKGGTLEDGSLEDTSSEDDMTIYTSTDGREYYFENGKIVYLEDDYSEIEEIAAEIEEIVNSEYLLPGSDSQYLTEADLYGFTAEQCRLARNEIYARHGRIFKDEALQEYFNSCSWYEPLIEPDDFQESSLNVYEVANRDLIVKYEEEKGYR